MIILSTPSVQVASRRIRMHYTNCSVAVGRQTLSSTAPQRPISKPVSRCENSRNHRGSRTPSSRRRARRGCGGWCDGPGSCQEHALPCHPMVPAYKRMEGGPCLPRSEGIRVVGQCRRPASTSPVAIRTVINMVPVRDSNASGCHPRIKHVAPSGTRSGFRRKRRNTGMRPTGSRVPWGRRRGQGGAGQRACSCRRNMTLSENTASFVMPR